MRVLIDTPVWSKAFRRKRITDNDKKVTDELKTLIDKGMGVIIGAIRQELLSGISKENLFIALKNKMKVVVDFPTQSMDYELAAEYYNTCRGNGIQGSNTDFLICAVAVRNNFEILTEDNDFTEYKKYLPIKLYTIF